MFGRKRYYITPPARILADSGVATPPCDEYTPDGIAALVTALGAPCDAVSAEYGASVIQYNLQLRNLCDYPRVGRVLPAVAARIRRNVTLSPSSVSDFSLIVPRQTRAHVGLKSAMLTTTFDDIDSPTAACLGTDGTGSVVALDVATMPHVLIAGATGSGKTVALHSILCSMLFKAGPGQVQFLMIDPKQVELTQYANLPHLWRPVVTDVQAAIRALEDVTLIMDKRYKTLRRKPKTVFPRLVVVIDELADLMLTSKKQAEPAIVRIAQLGRAAGIHLIVATQRPSVSVVTGLIKANMPCRIALTMASGRDSMTVIDRYGAERLTGKGDALLQTSDMCGGTIRFQCAYTSPDDVRAIVKYWTSPTCKTHTHT